MFSYNSIDFMMIIINKMIEAVNHGPVCFKY